ncbi:MAG: DUF3306 domain-containing protein [Hydrogenophaga sp.]|nr:DUF3306 domain-containing protein [Hydrogenophaga sp.]
MNSDDDGFFSRWSRRKAQARQGESMPEPVTRRAPDLAPPNGPMVAPTGTVPSPSEDTEAAPALTPNPAATGVGAPPPTLEEVQALTPDADFRRFVARDVSPEVRNAAVKKLFADPHFNVVDMLDVYMDDYSKPSPLDAADLAKMVSAQFLKLVDDPEDDKKTADDAADDASPPATEDTRAEDAAAPEETHDDDADLQLQPDHPPGPQSPGPGAG